MGGIREFASGATRDQNADKYDYAGFLCPLVMERLRSALDYDPDTGFFRWKESRGRVSAGQVAGCARKGSGYVRIGVDGEMYLAHRIAILFSTGHWPKSQVDHIDGDPTNNRLSNLRECTQRENAQNVGLPKSNTTGHPGVTFDASRGKYMAQIQKDGRRYGLGRFDTATAAETAYLNAKRELHTFNPEVRA